MQDAKTHVQDLPLSIILGKKLTSLGINVLFCKPGLLLELGQSGRLNEMMAMKAFKLENTKLLANMSYLHA